jgi:exonuclease VII small subunit
MSAIRLSHREPKNLAQLKQRIDKVIEEHEEEKRTRTSSQSVEES